MVDLIIIGARPAAISAAWEAQKLGLNYLGIEKKLIGNTIYQHRKIYRGVEEIRK